VPEPRTPTIGYGRIDTGYGLRLATTPPEDDGPVWMVNLMKYRDTAEYADGRASGLTGRQADDAYAPLESLAAVGAEVVFFGDVQDQFLGDEPRWDRIGVVKYPTRRAFIDMQARPEFQVQHAHKEAGMRETIVIGAQPIAVPALPDDAPDWADVPHPPTDDDRPVVIVHVIRFNEGGRDDDMVSYQNAAGAVAVPHGVRIDGWFEAEGTIIGDGRSWDQVRFNAFPSRQAFLAMALDPARLAAHAAHREPAIADTYTFLVRPTIDRIAESIR
jgi:hypothetical protein